MHTKGLAFRTGDSDKGINALVLWASVAQHPYRFFRKPAEVPPDWLPVGDVDWTQAVLGRTLVPDYYPYWLTPWVRRNVWKQDKWPLGHRVFVKPADRHKRFTGFVSSGTWKKSKKGPLWCSEIVRFENEWRYYVAGGKVLAAHWYWGDESRTPEAPELGSIAHVIPDGWCGTVDLGHLSDGRLTLVEAHDPLSCGWYGPLNEGRVYAEWLDAGWKFLCAANSAPTT
jgi:hypothetical protein